MPSSDVVRRSTQPAEMTPAQALEMVFGDFAPNTRRAYARVFRDFQAWLDIRELRDLEHLTSIKLLEYKTLLKNQNKSASSINQTMSALRKVFKVLTEFGYIKVNPLKSTLLRSEKVSDISNKGALAVSQLNSLVEANDKLPYDIRLAKLLRRRNGILLRFLYLTAARRSEAAGLKWTDIQRDGRFHVALIRKTKSGVPQRLKIRGELAEDLQEWKGMVAERGIESEWVFPSLSFRTLGRGMTGKGVNDVIKRLGNICGLSISAHYLRHTAITLALELGEPLQKVQAYARHSSANTTIRYYHDQEILQKNPTDRLPMI